MLNKIKGVFYKPILKHQQNKINEEFESEGFSDDLLERQIALNIKRHELDIPDKDNLNDNGYVQ